MGSLSLTNRERSEAAIRQTVAACPSEALQITGD